MTEPLTLDRLSPLVGDPFHLAAQPGCTFTLLEAQRAGRHEPPPGFRVPLSLLFLGPREPLFRQQTLTLEHPRLGRLELFMVPVGEQERGYLYESVLG